jgi:protein-L-isoaspartate(D-aspartate) O-methyltransferase
MGAPTAVHWHMRSLPARFVWCLLGLALSAGVRADDYAAARRQLVQEVRGTMHFVSAEIGKSELDRRVLEAIGQVPRQEFVKPAYASRAYLNQPLPIGYGQTISQPFIVALMTDLLQVGAGGRVLEVGTGSGYQAAVLSDLVKEVYSIEIIPALAEEAAARLRRLGYDNVRTRTGDGYYGWPEHAPYDAIIVTAAPSQIPPPLIRQLKPGGRMVIPVGNRFLTQYLVLVEKGLDGSVHTRELLPVRFVPLTGRH